MRPFMRIRKHLWLKAGNDQIRNSEEPFDLLRCKRGARRCYLDIKRWSSYTIILSWKNDMRLKIVFGWQNFVPSPKSLLMVQLKVNDQFIVYC